MRKLLTISLTCAMLSLSSGCWLSDLLGLPNGNSIPVNPRGTLADTSIQRDQQFADLPVPQGFIAERDGVFSYQCQAFRFGTFRYRGAWTFRKTWVFYDEQMPKMGWSKLSEKEEGPVVTEVWAKGRERAKVIMDTGIEYVDISIQVYNERPRGTMGPLASR